MTVVGFSPGYLCEIRFARAGLKSAGTHWRLAPWATVIGSFAAQVVVSALHARPVPLMATGSVMRQQASDGHDAGRSARRRVADRDRYVNVLTYPQRLVHFSM
jgi:hypothetical protein